ncbi:MAG: carotenoid oxygenase family protein [Halobacteriaceae archaeon]
MTAGDGDADGAGGARPGYELGFQSVETEHDGEPLPVEGAMPEWLSGSLVRNGPGLFEAGGETVEHWFDGLAMLRKFAIADGAVRYSNRFLRTEEYETVTREGAMAAGQFGSAPDASPVERLVRTVRPPVTDNANVHVHPVGDEYVAVTETTRAVRFDPATLTTLGSFAFDDDVPGQWRCAHSVRDPVAGETLNLLVAFGRQTRYVLTRRPDGSRQREVLAEIPVDEPAYTHSFAATPNYVVVTEPPFRVSPLDLVLPWRGSGSFVDNYDWRPADGTRFLVVDRSSGEVVARPRAGPAFVYHHVNAVERDDAVLVDLVAFDGPAAVGDLSLSALRAGEGGGPRGQLRRYRLPLSGGAAGCRRLHRGLTLPRCDERRRTRQYRHAYGQHRPAGAAFATGLASVDVETGRAATWESDLYVGEPVFVPRPGGEADDDGVLLAVGLDTEARRSALVVVDADSMRELARAPAPHVVPFDFHGRFLDGVQ